MSRENSKSFLERARISATYYHLGQKYGDEPYTAHLSAAVCVLQHHGIDDKEILAAAWLHDSIEDTEATREEIAERFGERVASLVDAVTDGIGKNRKIRKARPYLMIPQTPDSILVKLADRIANVKSSRVERPRLFGMYQNEQPEFREKLYDADDEKAAPLWAALESLL